MIVEFRSDPPHSAFKIRYVILMVPLFVRLINKLIQQSKLLFRINPNKNKIYISLFFEHEEILLPHCL